MYIFSQSAVVEYVPVEGGNLYCEKHEGDIKPNQKKEVIIFLHGGPGVLNFRYFLPHMKRLSKDYVCIFYDQRGSGRSHNAFNSRLITMPAFVEDLNKVRSVLAGEKVIIVGHSWGSGLALQYAMMYPQHVAKLILLHSVPLLAEEFTEFLKQWSERTASIKGVLEKIQSSQAFLNGDIVAHEQYWKICFSKYVYRSEDVNQLDLTVDKEAIATGRGYEHICFRLSYNV